MMPKSRLLIVSQYFWPENFRVNDLVAELLLRGYAITILTGIPNYPNGHIYPDFLSQPSRFSQFNGAKIIRAPMITRGNGGIRLVLNYISFAISASFVGALRLSRQPFDAIFVFQPSPITVALPAVLLRYITKTPLILWVQDLWPESLQALGVVNSLSLLSVIRSLVHFIYRRCDLILAQSKGFVPQIARHVRPATSVRFFPNWSENVPSGPVPLACEVPFAPDLFTVMFAGNVGDAQDFPAILAAANDLKHHPIRWVIVGDGRLASWVSSEIHRLSLQKQVIMLGRFPAQRMPSFFRHADALLVSLKDKPIFSMTVPSKLQTYLSAGLPIVAMLNGEGSDIVRNSGCGITCRAGDFRSLSNAVLQLSRTPPSQRMLMGRKGLECNQRDFARDTLIERLESWISELSST